MQHDLTGATRDLDQRSNFVLTFQGHNAYVRRTLAIGTRCHLNYVARVLNSKPIGEKPKAAILTFLEL